MRTPPDILKNRRSQPGSYFRAAQDPLSAAITLSNCHRSALFRLVQTNLPKLDEPTRPQHPTAEQAGSEHGRETGTNRAHKNDLR
jgi:hypothetical protein